MMNQFLGGIGKGQLVREVDALDGLMGVVTDKAGIHFKVLNASKGPAVHVRKDFHSSQGPRAQTDRELYKKHVQYLIFNTINLEIVEGTVDDLIVDHQSNQPKIEGLRLGKYDK